MEGLIGGIRFFYGLTMIGLIFLPLGVWKLIDILLWLAHHIHWS